MVLYSSFNLLVWPRGKYCQLYGILRASSLESKKPNAPVLPIRLPRRVCLPVHLPCQLHPQLELLNLHQVQLLRYLLHEIFLLVLVVRFSMFYHTTTDVHIGTTALDYLEHRSFSPFQEILFQNHGAGHPCFICLQLTGRF